MEYNNTGNGSGYGNETRNQRIHKKHEENNQISQTGRMKISEIRSNSNSIFENSNWLKTEEAAEYLRTSPKQLRNWVYQGKVKAYRLFGKSLRFKRTDLDFLHKTGGQSWV